jgi:hypothetical protein
MKTNTTNPTEGHRTGETLLLSLSHETAHAQMQLAAIVPGIAPSIAPANDTRFEPLEDKLHLIKLAGRIRLDSWSGCEEHRGTERERDYVAACTSIEEETGITARFIREIGHAKSEIPLPIGARALHLTVTGSLRQFDLELLVRACFPMIPSCDLVYCAPRGGLDGTMHVFVLANGGWQPVGPPAWLREPPANDLRVVAGPVRVGPEGERAEGVAPGSVAGVVPASVGAEIESREGSRARGES